MRTKLKKKEICQLLDQLKTKFKNVESYHFDSLEIPLFNFFNRKNEQSNFRNDESNNITSNRFPSINARIKHTLFYLLWSIKWNIYKFSKKKNFILCSFIENREISHQYIDQLIRFASETKSLLIHFGIIYSFSFLIKKEIVCIPFFLYKLFQNKVAKKKLSYRIYNELVISISRIKNSSLSNEFQRLIYKNLQIEECLDDLIKKLKSKGNIKIYIQDIDFYLERVILAGTCKKNSLKTISIDHSIIFAHDLPQYYTDYFFVWGRYHKDKLIYENQIDENKIFVIGKPQFNDKSAFRSNKKKKWIYFLPALKRQLIWDPERNIDHSFKAIRYIQNYIDANNPDIKLCIRRHPSDSDYLKLPDDFIECEKYYSDYELAFVEDSSVIIELLKSDLPIIYIKDADQNDNLSFGNYFPGLDTENNKENLFCSIESALENKFDRETRIGFLNFLVSQEELFHNIFFYSLKEIINS